LNNDRSILFCLAHPDDESFLVAGVACKYGGQEVRLSLVTATLGEAGKTGDPPVCANEELPVVREAELRRAVAILGIEHLHLLGYRDQQLAAAPHEQIRRQLVQLIRLHRPQIVITFDPNGANLHPDHIAISRFTSDAVAAASDSRWHPDLGNAHQVARLLWSPPFPAWEALRAGSLDDRAGIDFLIDIQAWSQLKHQALRAHCSQHLSIDRIFFSSDDTELLLSTELFRQAWGPRLCQRPSDDLFAGIEIS
jgi:LmbE family N-acetylglucosaminyl deacetylase